MKILIDADGSPVTNIVMNVAKEKKIELLLVCDTSHQIRVEYGEVIIVSKGMDSADFALIKRVDVGDIVITGDYGVAAMALAKKAYGIHYSGRWYTNDNMDQMLFERHMSQKARRGSGRHYGKRPKKRTGEDDNRFEESFRKLLNEVLDMKND